MLYNSGLEADQKVLTTHGVYACTATTALTVQNTVGVEEVSVTNPEFVGQQIRAVAEDVGFAGVKLGESYSHSDFAFFVVSRVKGMWKTEGGVSGDHANAWAWAERGDAYRDAGIKKDDWNRGERIRDNEKERVGERGA